MAAIKRSKSYCAMFYNDTIDWRFVDEYDQTVASLMEEIEATGSISASNYSLPIEAEDHDHWTRDFHHAGYQRPREYLSSFLRDWENGRFLMRK